MIVEFHVSMCDFELINCCWHLNNFCCVAWKHCTGTGLMDIFCLWIPIEVSYVNVQILRIKTLFSNRFLVNINIWGIAARSSQMWRKPCFNCCSMYKWLCVGNWLIPVSSLVDFKPTFWAFCEVLCCCPELVSTRALWFNSNLMHVWAC